MDGEEISEAARSAPDLDYGDMVRNIVTGVRRSSGTFLADGRRLREQLLEAGTIRKVPRVPTAVRTMCAVDGGRITKQLYSGDLLVAYATSAEAESAEQEGVGVSRQWSGAVPHSKDADKVCGIAMMSLEQAVLHAVDHDVRLIDGSFYSPVIEVNRTLSMVAPEARRLAQQIITDYSFVENLAQVFSPTGQSRFIALPKSDSSRDYGNMISREYEVEISVTDKILAAHLLEPGEMLSPRTLEMWRSPNLFAEVAGWAYGSRLAKQVAEAVEPARTAALNDRLVSSYVKPHDSPTVVKAEYFRNDSTPEDTDDRVANIVLMECAYTHAQEPAAQYKADVQAKGVATIERQLRELVIAELTRTGDAELAALFSTQYRT